MSEITIRDKIVEELKDKLDRVHAEKAECIRMNLQYAYQALHELQTKLEEEICFYEA